MPSQISHSIFVRDLFSELEISFGRDFGSDADAALHLGAQGPDIFYHNQRRMPSGLLIGSVLHRKGYASVAARMLEFCLTENRGVSSPEAHYLIAFISHGILDRILHPFINYRSGWVDAKNEESEKYRYAHPFLERILDLALWSYRGSGLDRSSRGADSTPAEDYPPQPLHFLSFGDSFDAGEVIPEGIRDMLIFSLSRSYQRMAGDGKLKSRIENAYLDSRGFYHYCEQPRSPQIPIRWAALLHPPMLPPDVDFTNIGGKQWCDPCDEGLNYSDSLYDLYDLALKQAVAVCMPLTEILKGGDPPENYPGLPSELGDHGLRNNVPGEDADLPCALTHCDALPLREILEIVASGEYPAHWLTWHERFSAEVPR